MTTQTFRGVTFKSLTDLPTNPAEGDIVLHVTILKQFRSGAWTAVGGPINTDVRFADSTMATVDLLASVGVAGQFLTTDGSGGIYWEDLPAPVYPTVTLQSAYDSDIGQAIVTTNSVSGSVNFSGTQSVIVSATQGLNLTNTGIFSSSTNADMVIAPNGNGAFQTSCNGCARGFNAVDMQMVQGTCTQAATGNYSTIGGGSDNTSSATNSSVVGGLCNKSTSPAATVGGGSYNTSCGNCSTVSGGTSNVAACDGAKVGGGASNTASGCFSTVGGGQGNISSNVYATVSGGQYNTACMGFSTISGGTANTAGECYTTIGGGSTNATNGYAATVGGGYYNRACGMYSSILGGTGNVACSCFSTIGGGQLNTVTGCQTVVGGGFNNTASGSQSSVGGGVCNTASGVQSTVSGGQCNTASIGFATIGGGLGNIASGCYTTIGGGAYNTACMCGSVAVGVGALTTCNADFVVGNQLSAVASSADNVHFRIDGRSSDVHIGRQTNQTAVAAANNALYFHPTTFSQQASYVALKAPATITSWTLTLPSTMGIANQFLMTDGFGNTSWGTISASPLALAGSGLVPNNTTIDVATRTPNYLDKWSNGISLLTSLDNSISFTVGVSARANPTLWGATNTSLLTLQQNSSTPLAGTTSYQLTHVSSGVASIQTPLFTLDQIDLGAALSWSQAVSGVVADGNYDMVLDRYNSSNIYQETISFVGNTSVSGSTKLPVGTVRFSTFAIARNTLTDRYAVRWRRLGSSTENVLIDELKLGPQQTVSGMFSMAPAQAGFVHEYAGLTIPTGWALCDGSPVSRSAFPDLFNNIGTTWGTGDGTTTFNLPDFRESALVGTGTYSVQTGYDTAKHPSIVAHDTYTLGQFKDDQSQGHVHLAGLNAPGASAAYSAPTYNNYFSQPYTGDPVEDTHSNGLPRTGTTTRGKRIGVNYIIKLYNDVNNAQLLSTTNISTDLAGDVKAYTAPVSSWALQSNIVYYTCTAGSVIPTVGAVYTADTNTYTVITATVHGSQWYITMTRTAGTADATDAPVLAKSSGTGDTSITAVSVFRKNGGWAVCNGSLASRTLFAELFNNIGTTYGAGDGLTTFGLPDYRESALVGVGTRGAGVTAHDTYTLGQFKDDQFQGHWHQLDTYANDGVAGASGNDLRSTGAILNDRVKTAITDGTNGTPRTGTTTHGKQIGVNYIIRLYPSGLAAGICPINGANLVGSITNATIPATSLTGLSNNYGIVGFGGSTIPIYLASGTYSPTAVTGTNVTAVAANNPCWIRLGNAVHVSGFFTVTTAAGAATNSTFYLPLPVASTITSFTQVSGVGSYTSLNAETYSVSGDSGNNRAEIDFKSNNTAARNVIITFSYTVQ